MLITTKRTKKECVKSLTINKKQKRFLNMPLIMSVLFIVFILSIIFSIGLGSVQVAPRQVVRVLSSHLFGTTQNNFTPIENNIVWVLRLPRVLLGAIVGATLAVVGVTMQALVRNNLADPYILGVSSGASVAATLAIITGVFGFLGTYALPVGAFIGAMVTMMFVYWIAQVKGRIQISQLLLCGIAVSMSMDGIKNVIILSAPNALGLHNATFWMSGSLASAKWGYLGLPFFALIIGLCILLVHYRQLNLITLGDNSAISLGVNVKNTHKLLMVIASIMTGIVVSVSGVIGFVGLMVPHIARLFVGANHKYVLPASAFLGAILIIWVDVAARMIIAPEELPVGVLTAVFGGPIFIILLKRKTKKD